MVMGSVIVLFRLHPFHLFHHLPLNPLKGTLFVNIRKRTFHSSASSSLPPFTPKPPKGGIIFFASSALPAFRLFISKKESPLTT